MITMITFDRVKSLADNNNISIVELEKKLGFSKNSLYSWKKNKPSIDKLNIVADYFGVTTDYLLGRTETPQFTSKDERDIQHMLDDMINGLSDKNSLAYMKNGGEELDEEAAELLRDSLERTARRAKILAKEKFTPKKYRKDNKSE
ncbi:TPA: helix-turn-helix transcriptional regulator [Enterococcus faecalis]|nr:helix-turn-helix transcriptional regulator [Enterococcus faecalis]